MLGSLVHATGVFAAIVAGLATGAVVTEGAILVPFWRSIPPRDFLAWYRAHAALLFKFFGPLEIVAAASATAATLLAWWSGAASASLWSISAFLSIAVLAMFPMYFQSVNARFAAGAIDADQVGPELARWAMWHWVRVGIAGCAFVAAVLAVGRPCA